MARKRGRGTGRGRNATTFKKGDPRINRKGRPVGSQNKFTRDIKEMILGALEEAGGQQFFSRLARQKDKRTFAQLVGKLLPTRLAGHDGGPLDAQVASFQAGLANLDEKELAQFQELMKKVNKPATGTNQ